MPSVSRDETHPLERIGASPAEIERRTEAAGEKVPRPNVWAVIHRRRDRLSWDSYQTIKSIWPTFDVDAAMKWKWSDHGGFADEVKRSKRGGRHASR